MSLMNILEKITKKNKNGNDSDSDDRDFPNYTFLHQHTSRKQCGHVGLKNLGCICYLNSTMHI